MLNWLYELIARTIGVLHDGLAPVFGASSGWSWGLAIVFLVMIMRLLLFPLFVKQIRTQRAMQTIQPQMKEMQTRYKAQIAKRPAEKQKLQGEMNAEMMKLYREHGANPFTGCLPLLLQMPVFFALFTVLRKIDPAHYDTGVYGLTGELVRSAAHAKIFGAPIASAFNSPHDLLRSLDASPTTVRVVATVMVVLMGATTFWTQRQLMARTAASGGAQMPGQKVLLYVLPFTFFIFGFQFPIGVLLYWLTTNVWSMVQQHFVIAKMGAYAPAPAAGPGSSGSATSPATRRTSDSSPTPRPQPAGPNGSPPRAPAGTPASRGAAAPRRTAGSRARRRNGRRGRR